MQKSYADTVSSGTIVRTHKSAVVTLPYDDYKGIVGFAKRCNEYAQECQSRVLLYEQYEMTAKTQIDELTRYAAQLEAEKDSKVNPWLVFGLSLAVGFASGVYGGYQLAH